MVCPKKKKKRKKKRKKGGYWPGMITKKRRGKGWSLSRLEKGVKKKGGGFVLHRGIGG